MTAAIEAFAPAKINLTLHVTGQRDDGYSLIDSLVVFGDVGDRITLTRVGDMSLSAAGPFAAGVPEDESNLVWRALNAVGWQGSVSLIKNLPNGAGIGGGSSDAAAVLRRLHGERAGVDVDLDLLVSLGADVPVCLSPRPQRMRGIGEELAHVPSVPALSMVLVNPGAHVPTRDVFAGLATRDNAPMETFGGWASWSDFVDWLALQRNDLEAAACSVAPEIKLAQDALRDARLVRMSGSGSTCFGIYPDQTAAQRAAGRIKSEHPDWWVQPTETIGSAAGRGPITLGGSPRAPERTQS